MSEHPQVVGIVEIAVLLGVRRATVDTWRQRGVFPAPVLAVGGRPAWERATVVRWAIETGRSLGAMTFTDRIQPYRRDIDRSEMPDPELWKSSNPEELYVFPDVVTAVRATGIEGDIEAPDWGAQFAQALYAERDYPGMYLQTWTENDGSFRVLARSKAGHQRG